MIEREKPIEKRAADRLIDRVMASDIFPDDERIAAQVEDAGGMDATGPSEVSLGGAQTPRQFQQGRLRDLRSRCGIDGRKLLPDEFDAGFATEPAAAGNRAEALGCRGLELHARRKLDV